jgi:dTDP-4-dehydrorhamnose 3,5-epimerase
MSEHKPLRISKCDIEDARVIDLDCFEDHRGVYVEIYNEALYDGQKLPKFVQDDYSISRRDVLRGLHGDQDTWKLITCPIGQIYFVILDVRKNSPSFNKWQSFVISEQNHRQILVPPGCANGHLVTSERAMFHYKQSTYYSRNQFTVRWDDPQYKLWWPIANPILSRRDQVGHYVD